jgi:iron uptake system component EfeO
LKPFEDIYMKHTFVLAISGAAALLAACGDDPKPKTDAEFKAEIVTGMHDKIAVDLTALVTASTKLRDLAPDHAWGVADAETISKMKDAWKEARVAYEHVEGATAPIFADLDVSMDERYDGFLDAFMQDGGSDDYLFDGEGVTGMHAIERILYAPTIRAEVIDFEDDSDLYVAAAFPATPQEATDFKTKLVQRLIDDAGLLRDQWQPARIDIAAAFQGLEDLMGEQQEKVDLAATGAEESRYSNLTLFDLRNNLAGTKTIYEIFRPWILSKGQAGVDADTKIEAKLAALATLYGTTNDALPEVPMNWSGDAPSAADLATPFGMLWSTVRANVDATATGSVVFEMNLLYNDVLGFPPQPAE